MLKDNLDKIKDYIDSRNLREKPNYDTSMWAIYNYPRDKEFLFFIQERAYKKCRDDSIPQWYYSGVIFEIDDVMNKEILNNLWHTFSYNISEKHMKPLESILKKSQ